MKIDKLIINVLAKNVVRGNMKRRKRFPSLKEFDGMLDVPYIDDGINYHRFDLFRAKEKNRKHICVIDVHGGAYIFCEHRDNYPFGHDLLKRGFDFVAIDYLPNNGKMNTKSSIDDCVRCINHIFKHLEEYGLENDRFIIAGDSAGGHFALLLAEAINDKEIAKKLDFQFLDNVKVEMVILNCPVYDFANIGNGILTKSARKRMFGPNHNNPEVMKLVSPRTYFESFNLPFFVSTCTKDFIRAESLTLKEDGEKYHKDMTFLDIESTEAGVEHVHNVLRPTLKESIQVNNAIEDFVLKHI